MSKEQIRYAGGDERCGRRRVGLLIPLGDETHKQGTYLGKVGEGHDQRGGVMQRQVKMWLERGPAPGSSM